MRQVAIPLRARNWLLVGLLILLWAMACPLLSSLFAGLAPEQETAIVVPTVTRISGSGATNSTLPITVATAAPSRTLPPVATITPLPTFTLTSTPRPTNTPLPTTTPSNTPIPRTYLIPYRQVVGLNENSPAPAGQVWLYEGYNDVFEIVQQQGTSVKLQSPNGAVNFWSPQDALASKLPPAPAVDATVRGRRAQLRSSTVQACAYNSSATLAFGQCGQLPNVSTVALIAAINAGTTRFYQVEVNGQQYIINAADVVAVFEPTSAP